jgi:hypothetical protein
LVAGEGRRALAASPRHFDLIVLSHVLYYIPAEEWPDLFRLAGARLSVRGSVAVALVSGRSEPYQFEFASMMEAAGCGPASRSPDGKRLHAEDTSLFQDAHRESWAVHYGVQGSAKELFSFLAFLYRCDEDIEHLVSRATLSAMPTAFTMLDRWTLLSREDCETFGA